MTNSISATERVRLWNRFHQPLDHENVKLEFFRRVNTRHPPFRTKTSLRTRAYIEVPAIVRYHYEHPPALLPSMRQTLRYDRVKQRKNLPTAVEEISRETVTESLLNHLEALRTARAKFREIQREYGTPETAVEGDSDSDTNPEGEQDSETTTPGDKVNGAAEQDNPKADTEVQPTEQPSVVKVESKVSYK